MRSNVGYKKKLEYMRLPLAILCLLLALWRAVPVIIAVPLWVLGLGLLLWALATKKTGVRRSLYTLCAVLFSFLLTVLVLEGGARLLFAPEYDATSIVHPHPEIREILRPDTRSQMRLQVGENAVEMVPISISKQGLRNPELPAKKAEEYRVFMLGDSFTMGWGLQDSETIPQQLKAQLSAHAPERNITVINGGILGTAAWQQKVFFEERGLRHDPDLVVLQVYGENDIVNTLEKLDEIPGAASEWDDLWWRLLKRRHYWSYEFDHWLRRKSLAYQRFLNITGRNTAIVTLMDQFRPFPDRGDKPEVDLENLPFWIDVNKTPWTVEYQIGWEALQEDILAIVEVCRDADIDVLLYCIPSSASAIDSLWESSVEQTDNSFTYERYKDTSILETFFQKRQLNWIPVHQAILAHEEPESLYYQYDGHLTPAGTQVVASAIADYLQTQELLPAEKP